MRFLEWLGLKKMIDDTDPKNVVKFPELKKVPPMPEVVPPKEKDAKVYYRFGITDNNRVAFSMGYTEITMNREGCQNLIDQIAFFMNQLDVEEDDDSN
jgi:hypothetical protein